MDDEVQGKALQVIFLPLADVDPLWQAELAAAIDPRHELRILDRNLPLNTQFAGVDVVIDMGGSVGTRELLDAARDVRLWQILGTGVDHFDMAHWREHGVPVANCPGTMSAVALAEHALMLMLMVSRRLPELQANLSRGVLCDPTGSELVGKTLCLIGFGASARELAVRARAMGMRIVAVDIVRFDEETLRDHGVEQLVPPEQLDSLLEQADVVSLHLHLAPETRHLLDADRIARIKRGAIVVNVARGALIDEAALVDAVERGHLSGAGVDVFETEPPPHDSPLLSTRGIICTPHAAGVTDGTARRRAAGAALNIERVSKGLEPFHRVDKL